MSLKSILSILTGGATGITPEEAIKRLCVNPKPVLIDVRSTQEYHQVRISNSRLIPINELQNRLSEIPKNKPVLLYCQSGGRSTTALNILKSMGFEDVEQIDGGISAWIRSGLRVESGKPSRS